MIVQTLTLLISLMTIIESKVDNPVKSQSTFHEKIVLKSEFKDDMFTIDMSYANETVSYQGEKHRTINEQENMLGQHSRSCPVQRRKGLRYSYDGFRQPLRQNSTE